MIPQRDQPWFEFQIVQPDGSEFTESLPAETVREATEKMRRIYPEARLTLTRHYKKEMDFGRAGPKFARGKKAPPPSPPRGGAPPPQPPAKKKAESDFRAVFGLGADADFPAIKAAYREALKRYHPDRVAGLGDEFIELAEQKTREYNAAYKAARKHFGQ